MTLVCIVGYICCKDEKIDDTFFYYEKYESFSRTTDHGKLKIPGDMVFSGHFIVVSFS